MDDSNLKQLIAEWKRAKQRADRLAELISEAVLSMRCSLREDGVEAVYYKERMKMNYQAAAERVLLAMAPEERQRLLGKYTDQRVLWRALFKELEENKPLLAAQAREDFTFVEKPPRVVLRIKE